MSTEMMYVLIARMHLRLNKIIEESSYNLQNDEVQQYSQRLDKVLTHYNKTIGKSSVNRFGSFSQKESWQLLIGFK